MNHFPKISIVTPNYNYGHLLEETILSVLNQNYPNLEYIIIDGGSNDNSVEIIKKYESRISYWVSERDNGIYDALNKGFKKCTGEIMAYLNSDDCYLPWSFKTISSVFSDLPDVEWVSTLQPGYIDFVSKAIWFGQFPGFSKKAFLEGYYSGNFSKFRFIQQESTFWKRSLWKRTGGCISTKYKMAGDFFMWNEFYKKSELFGIPYSISLFRANQHQKSADIDQYISECAAILKENDNIEFRITDKIQNFFGPSKFKGKIIKRNNIGNDKAEWMLEDSVFSF